MSAESAIDLSRYKTDELVSNVAEILSVPEAILTVVRTTGIAVVCLLAVNSAVNVLGESSWFPWLVSSLYSLAIALLLGFGLGLIRVAAGLLSRVEALLQLTLEISLAAAEDVRAVSGGEKRMPNASEIVEHVYDEVILPAVETVVAKTFGIIGKPLLWVYRRTICEGVRFLIKRMKTESLSEEGRNEIEQESAALIRDLGEDASGIERAIDGAMGYTRAATGALRKILLLPMRTVFTVVATIAVIPLLACWYLSR